VNKKTHTVECRKGYNLRGSQTKSERSRVSMRRKGKRRMYVTMKIGGGGCGPGGRNRQSCEPVSSHEPHVTDGGGSSVTLPKKSYERGKEK